MAHQRLLVKLESIGIKGDLLNWVRSFLNGRKQCVKVNGVTSGWKDVLSGIPQGSVIGPLLFVIFINDMPNEVKFNLCKLFADDCKLYGKVKHTGENKMQLDVTNLENWSAKWQLPFNATKCKVMHLGYNNPKHRYVLNSHTLDISTCEKDLGVHVDNQLKFHEHTAAATKTANQVLGVIKKAYKTRDIRTITMLYKSMVRPHLEYGNLIWGPFFKEDMKSVEKIQRRATKLVTSIKDLAYEDRLRALKLPSLVYRRRRGDMIQMYKLMNGLIRVEIKSLVQPTTEFRTRGHHQKVQKNRANKFARANCFSQRVANNWNSLPKEVISAPSLNTFKNRLDAYWEGSQYETPF